MDFVARAYPEMIAGGFSRIDGTVQFYTRVNSLLNPSMTVVDFGAGRAEWFHDDPLPFRRSLRAIKGKVAKVIGVDVDPVVLQNPAVDESATFDGSHIPLPSASIDMVVSDHVFEHLPDPATTVAELDRILVPGGWLCIRTPNKYGYVALLNRMIPESAKSAILHFAQPGRKDEDVFPAHYRLNTRAAFQRYFPGYDIALHTWESEPAYHGGRPAIFHAMRAWNSLVPRSMKNVLLVFLRKPVQ